MTKIIEYLKKEKYLIIISLIFLLIRLPWLNSMFLLHDERDITLSAYSIAQTGKDLYGNSWPLNFRNINPDNPLGSIYFQVLTWMLFPFSLYMVRLPFVVIATLLVPITFYIILTITEDKKTAFLTTIILNFSPWIYHLTRTALDVPIATVFVFGGVLLYLKKQRLLAYLAFLFALFTYQGFRTLIPFLLLYLEFFFFIKSKKIKPLITYSVINGFFIILSVLLILWIDIDVTEKRYDQVIFFNTVKLTEEVNLKRWTSLAPEVIKPFFHNKLNVSFDYILDNLTKALDMTFLFKTGDFSAINGPAMYGQFFYPFIIFFYLGIYSLINKHSKYLYYLAGFIFVGLIPGLLSTNGISFGTRGVLATIGYSLILTLGVEYFITLANHLKPQSKLLVYSVTAILFAVSISYFAYGYFFRRPMTVGEIFNEHERQLGRYLSNNQNRPLTVYSDIPEESLLSYFLIDNNKNIVQLQQTLQTSQDKIYQYNGVVFLPCNSKLKYHLLRNSVIHEKCLNPRTYGTMAAIESAVKIPYQDISTKFAYIALE